MFKVYLHFTAVATSKPQKLLHWLGFGGICVLFGPATLPSRNHLKYPQRKKSRQFTSGDLASYGANPPLPSHPFVSFVVETNID